MIKACLGLTDEELGEQITENLSMQYFVGLEGYCATAPFGFSMMVHFRKRLGEEALRECNELSVKHGYKSIKEHIAAIKIRSATPSSASLGKRS